MTKHRTWNLSLLAACMATALAVSCAPAPAAAQSLRVATGSAKGTYSSMFKEMQAACGNEVAMVEMPSTGSIENVNALVGNGVNAAFVQSDVLYLKARTEEMGNIKTLLALHPEQVHILALSAGRKEGGVMGVGAKAVVLHDLSQLGGRQVGAAGGSVVTAQVMRLQSEVAFNVVPFDTNDLLLKALAAGEVDAAVLVGGAPLPVVAALGPQFKLLAILPLTAERLKGVYRTDRLSYPKMGAAGVPTVATDALFVTREYKLPKMVDSLGRFRACALSKIDELKETTGTHPAWQRVNTGNRGKWAYYELPVRK